MAVQTQLNQVGWEWGRGGFPQRKWRCCFRKTREYGLGWSKQQMVITGIITRRFQELSRHAVKYQTIGFLVIPNYPDHSLLNFQLLGGRLRSERDSNDAWSI